MQQHLKKLPVLEKLAVLRRGTNFSPAEQNRIRCSVFVRHSSCRRILRLGRPTLCLPVQAVIVGRGARNGVGNFSIYSISLAFHAWRECFGKR